MSQRYNDNIKRQKPLILGISARDLKNLCILPENSEESLGSTRECCWNYIVSVSQNAPKNLVVQGGMQLGHSSHIVRVSVNTTCCHFNPWHILKETTELAGPFGTRPQKPWHPGKGVNMIALSNPTVGKCTTMEIMKQTEHGRTSTTKEQKWSSFQTD